MTGQDAVHAAEEFHRAVNITGLILTKMDGDARGGAALSIRQVTGVPIKFMGTGEKTDALEVFHPDRLAQRILGMGDVLSLIEKAQEQITEDEAKKLEKKMRTATFNLDGFLESDAPDPEDGSAHPTGRDDSRHARRHETDGRRPGYER